jgi:pilus assembly protein CpaB
LSISIRTIATLAVAAFLGLVAVFIAQNFIINGRQSAAVSGPTGSTVNVAVAAQAIDRDAVLQPSMLKVVSYPANAAPAGVFHSVGELIGGQGQQRVALRPIVANEPILPGNVTGPGGKGDLSAVVSPGMRAVSLRSNDVVGVGGLVLPGDRVDVLLTRTMTGTGNAAQTSLTQILAENVRVLGIDQSYNDQDNKPAIAVAKAVTVEVTPDQAESITLGSSVGTVSLSLRHVADDALLTKKVMTVSDLGPDTPHVAKGGPRGDGIRVIRGTSSSRFNFSVGGALSKMSTQAPAGVNTP